MEELGQGSRSGIALSGAKSFGRAAHLSRASDATTFITCTGESQDWIKVKGETGVASGTGALNTPH